MKGLTRDCFFFFMLLISSFTPRFFSSAVIDALLYYLLNLSAEVTLMIKCHFLWRRNPSGGARSRQYPGGTADQRVSGQEREDSASVGPVLGLGWWHLPGLIQAGLRFECPAAERLAGGRAGTLRGEHWGWCILQRHLHLSPPFPGCPLFYFVAETAG